MRPNFGRVVVGVAHHRSRVQAHEDCPGGDRTNNVVKADRTLPHVFCDRFVKALLTANSVVAVMPAFMVMVPNPRSRNYGPEYWDGGVHYVWPFKFGLRIAIGA